MDKKEKSRLLDFLEIIELMKKSYYHSIPFKATRETRKVDDKLEAYLIKYGESFDSRRYILNINQWELNPEYQNV